MVRACVLLRFFYSMSIVLARFFVQDLIFLSYGVMYVNSGVFWANGWTFAFRINFEGKHRFTDSEVYLFIKVYSDDFKYRDLHLNCHHALVLFFKEQVNGAALTNVQQRKTYSTC
jgi:hypothetical protein